MSSNFLEEGDACVCGAGPPQSSGDQELHGSACAQMFPLSKRHGDLPVQNTGKKVAGMGSWSEGYDHVPSIQELEQDFGPEAQASTFKIFFFPFYR